MQMAIETSGTKQVQTCLRKKSPTIQTPILPLMLRQQPVQQMGGSLLRHLSKPLQINTLCTRSRVVRSKTKKTIPRQSLADVITGHPGGSGMLCPLYVATQCWANPSP